MQQAIHDTAAAQAVTDVAFGFVHSDGRLSS